MSQLSWLRCHSNQRYRHVSAFVAQVPLQSTLSTTHVDKAHATAGTIIGTLSTLSMVAGASSIRSVGDAFSTGKGPCQCRQVGARRREVRARAWAKRVLPRAATAAAIVAHVPGRARGDPLPTTIPTTTTGIFYSSNGYTGTVGASGFTFESCALLLRVAECICHHCVIIVSL